LLVKVKVNVAVAKGHLLVKVKVVARRSSGGHCGG